MDVRALSHPSIQYSLPYLEGLRQERDPSVVLTLLDVAFFLEDGSSMYDSDDHLQMRKGGCVNYDVTPHIIAHMYLQMRKGSAKVCEV